MQNIILGLKEAIEKEGSLVDNLNEYSPLVWQENYPVAVVHEKVRVKDEATLVLMEQEKLFDKEGITPQNYNSQEIDFFRKNSSNYLKIVTLMGMEKQGDGNYLFKEKRPHDYWKKIENQSNFKAVVECSTYDEDRSICQIEANLRDIMRSSKEVPSIKVVGFIWVATVPKSTDITSIMQHYFLKNYTGIEQGSQTIYIGWSPSLKKINMRYFVCPPLFFSKV